jgi:hypothetical protein
MFKQVSHHENIDRILVATHPSRASHSHIQLSASSKNRPVNVNTVASDQDLSLSTALRTRSKLNDTSAN